ncbi:helix-turn-helix domain-containing protein [Streptomyces sp. NPDC041068]|uniref:helix-turn-helix domain-containing protein n=1 Tax=Streptomyces sp. NPDC041068 TaxID=3155130 RepID=UPI0033E87F31
MSVDRPGGAASAPPAECGQLSAELRELRERTGLSLAALALRTPYSKSSWERYLNGKKPAPRQAVVALCGLAGEEPGRLLALWELADAAWSGRAARSGVAVPGVGSGVGVGVGVGAGVAASGSAEEVSGASADAVGPVARRRRGVVFAAGVAAAAVLAGLAVAAGVGAGSGAQGGPGAARGTAPAPYEPRCVGRACEGKDPVRMGCGGQGQVASLAVRDFADARRVELRHGKACHAVWVRARGLRPGDRVELTVPGAARKTVAADEARDARRYLATRMTATVDGGRGSGGPSGARVCLVTAGSEGRQCFGG